MFDLQNPLAIIAIAAAAIVIIALLLFVVLRLRRRNNSDKFVSNERDIVMEREWQFKAAAEQMRYLKDSSEIAREIASLFRDILSLPVLAIYAGREGDPRISKLFGAGQGSEVRENESLATLPATFPSSIIFEYQQPRLTRLSALIVGGTTDGDRGSPYQTAELVEPGASPRPRPDGRVTILPWRGAFDWMGVVVAGATESTTPDTLVRYREALPHISDR
jgi:hypothetical protein